MWLVATIDTDWSRVGPAIEERMVALGLDTQAAAAAAAGVHVETFRDVLLARRKTFKKITLNKIERGLRWPPNTLLGIAIGRDPASFPTMEYDATPATHVDSEAGRAQDEAARPALLSGKLDRLSERDRRIIEAMVDEMLGEAEA